MTADTRLPSPRRAPNPARTVVIGVIALVIVAVVVIAAVFAVQVRAVNNDVSKASDTAQTLFDKLGTDPDGAEQMLPKLQKELAQADSDSDASLFASGRHLPVYGSDVKAARKAIDAFTLLSQQSLPVLVSGARYVDLKNHSLRGGASSLPKLIRLTPQLVPALTSFADAKSEIDSIDTEPLHGKTKDGITQLQHEMDDWGSNLAPFTSAAESVKKGQNTINVWKKALDGAFG